MFINAHCFSVNWQQCYEYREFSKPCLTEPTHARPVQSKESACIITTHIILQRRTHMQEETYKMNPHKSELIAQILLYSRFRSTHTHIRRQREIYNNSDTKQLKFFHFPPTQLPHVPSSTRNLTLAYASTTQRYEMSIFYSAGDVDLPRLGLRTHNLSFSLFSKLIEQAHWYHKAIPINVRIIAIKRCRQLSCTVAALLFFKIHETF